MSNKVISVSIIIMDVLLLAVTIINLSGIGIYAVLSKRITNLEYWTKMKLTDKEIADEKKKGDEWLQFFLTNELPKHIQQERKQ